MAILKRMLRRISYRFAKTKLLQEDHRKHTGDLRVAKLGNPRVAKYGTSASLADSNNQIETIEWELRIIEKEMRRRHSTLMD